MQTAPRDGKLNAHVRVQLCTFMQSYIHVCILGGALDRSTDHANVITLGVERFGVSAELELGSGKCRSHGDVCDDLPAHERSHMRIHIPSHGRRSTFSDREHNLPLNVRMNRHAPKPYGFIIKKE